VLKEQDFNEMLKNVWTQDRNMDDHRSNSLERLKNKLKGLKKEIKLQRGEVFVSEKFKRQQILDEIEAIDTCDDDDILHEDKRVRRIQLLSDLRDMSERETGMIKQKGRAYCIAKGDMNSKLFHF